MEKRILIAEDEKDILVCLAKTLEWQGYKVKTAGNNDLAQALFALIYRTEQKPDLMICDFQLPVSGGEELIADIRQVDTDIPIIAITGNGNRELEDRLVKLGCTAVIKKPFTHKFLLERIKPLLNPEKKIEPVS